MDEKFFGYDHADMPGEKEQVSRTGLISRNLASGFYLVNSISRQFHPEMSG